jgi:hypothetical protein
MFSDQAVADLIGRRIIVGITYEDHLQRPLSEEQYHGRIIRANAHEGIVIQTPAGDEKVLPADLRSVRGAKPGAYKLRSTGETIADAELTTAWTRYRRLRSSESGLSDELSLNPRTLEP